MTGPTMIKEVNMGLFGCDYLETIGTFMPEYRCKYSHQTLSSRTAQDICMSSRYIDCADYKNATRCFITTAVCLTLGKPDDCEELVAMRAFRDEWLRDQPDGPELIDEYYKVAPNIVENINKEPNRREIFADIYDKFISPCVEHAKLRDFQKSKDIYVDMVNTLSSRYCQL